MVPPAPQTNGFMGFQALGKACMTEQAESDKFGKAGRGQILRGLVDHLALWGLYPELMRSQ